MKITYCDKCGQKIEVGSNYGGKIKRESGISYPTELNDGKLITDVYIEIDVVPKQFDICTGCRIEAADKVVSQLKREYNT